MATWSSGISLRGTAGAMLRYGNGAPTATNPSQQNDGDSYIDLNTGNLYAVRQNGQWPTTYATLAAKAGTNGSVIRTGTGTPSSSNPATQVDGDYFFATDTGTFWGPRASGAWPSSGTSLVGTPGTNFITGTATPGGSLGNNGDTFLDTNARILYQKSGGAWSVLGQSYNITTTGSATPGSNYSQNNDFYVQITNGITYLWQKVNGTWNQLAQLTGAPGSNATIPNDITGNSLAIAPVSGDSTAVSLSLANSSGKQFTVDASGDVAASGTLSVTGNTSLGNVSASGTLSASGNTTLQNLTVNGSSQFAAVSTGNVTGTGLTINGTASISGNTSTGALTASSLTTSGALSSGNASVSALTASSSSITNNETVGGTLKVTGATTLGQASTGALAASSLNVSGSTTLAAVNASSVATSAGVTVGSTLSVTGSTTLAAVSAGAITCSGFTNSGTNSAAAIAVTLPSSGAATYPILLKSNGGTTLLSVDTSGNVICGNITASAVTASSVAASGAISAKSITLTSGGGGLVTYADGTTQSTATTTGPSGLSVLYGNGAPASSLGVTGQPGYIDEQNNVFYAAKTSSGWPSSGVNIQGPSGVSQPSLGSYCSSYGPSVWANGIASTSTATNLPAQGSTFTVPFVAPQGCALMGYQLTSISNSTATFTIALVDTTANSTVYSTTIAKGTVASASFTSTQYPMTAGDSFYWQVSGSGTAYIALTPQYLTPASSAIAATWYSGMWSTYSGQALSSTVTAMFVPGTSSSTQQTQYYRNSKTSYLYQANLLIGSGTGNVTFTLSSGSAVYTSPSYTLSSSSQLVNIGPFGPSTALLAAGTNYYWAVSGSGSPSIGVQMQVVQ